MKIPFSPPFVNEEVEAEVISCLRSGWITSGPKVKELEELCAGLSSVGRTVAVNSWTSGCQLVYKWLGLGPGDEVIVPAYTYSATALTVLHTGATLVMVDVLDDFTIDPKAIKKALNQNTRAIVAVDIAGWPCDYDAIREVILDSPFTVESSNVNQTLLGKPLLISDAAHSIGAKYKNQPAAKGADITIYSLHAVKNVTTAEGGIICLNLPAPFDNEEVYRWMKLNSLNGQTKDAFSKTMGGGWRYDIVSAGLKINMPDICAAIGLAQLRLYPDQLLKERKRVFNHYLRFFEKFHWAILPQAEDEDRESSYHLFPLRLKNVTEEQRDTIIDFLTTAGISTNVHFIPMPMLSLFKGMGYDIEEYPVAYKNYACEISLPIYPQLKDEECSYIEQQVKLAVENVVC